MCMEAQFESAVARLLRLTALAPGSTPQARYLVDYTSIPAEYNECFRESNDRTNSTAGILDILGVYRASDKTIVLFAKAIKDCASRLNAREEDLRTLVVYHEVAHMVTHLGHGHGAEIWLSFSAASINVVEFYAQIYSHFAFERMDRPELVDLLKQLSGRSPSPYRSYLRAIPCPIELVNGFLYADRGGSKMLCVMSQSIAKDMCGSLSGLKVNIEHDAPVTSQDLRQLERMADNCSSNGALAVGDAPVSGAIVERVRRAKDGDYAVFGE